MQRLTLTTRITIAFALLACCACSACSKTDDDRTIRAAPDRAAASSSAEARVPALPTAPPPTADQGTSANPLAMQLKHDGVPAASPAPSDSADPCAPPERTGPLAMRLRHDGPPPPPGQRNPLCMRIK
jgi:hypothetical protein